MIVKKIFLFGIFMSLVACEFDNQSISVIVEIENGSIKGVQEGNLKKYLTIKRLPTTMQLFLLDKIRVLV